MLSNYLLAALEKQVAGQPRAVQSVVRGVTRALAGLVPREGPQCAYLFIGPTGTGKTHLVRTLAKILHGDERRLLVADCTHFAAGDPWNAFVGQMTPLFVHPRMEGKWAVLDTPPHSIILIDYLERGRPEVSKALAASFETGRVTLPEGRQGSLRNCLLFITSSLCSREILDESPGIGFASGLEDEDDELREKLLKTCYAQAEERFGTDLLGRLDGLVIFRRLQDHDMSAILDRLLEDLNRWLLPRGFQIELHETARSFLLDHGRRNLKLGSRDLVRAHRRFLEFPVADLMISGRIPPGGLIGVTHQRDEEHLHFAIHRHGSEDRLTPDTVRSVPIAWETEAPSTLH